MADTIYVIEARNRAFHRYHTLSTLFHSQIVAVLCLLSNKIFVASKGIVFYWFVIGMGTNSLLMVLATRQCTKSDWKKGELRNRSVSYGFESAEVFEMEEETLPTSKRS